MIFDQFLIVPERKFKQVAKILHSSNLVDATLIIEVQAQNNSQKIQHGYKPSVRFRHKRTCIKCSASGENIKFLKSCERHFDNLG